MLTYRTISYFYRLAQKRAERAFESGKMSRALEWIARCAEMAYQVNWIYTDDALEKLLQKIAEKTISRKGYCPQENRVCFYDAFFMDNRGLSQQYLRALMAAGKEILVITENQKPEASVATCGEVRQYERCTIVSLPKTLTPLERTCLIYEKIADFAPKFLLMHLAPFSAEAVAAFYALKGTVRCQINLTDHAFWLGAGVLDYSLEFRGYGCTVSEEKRGIPKEKLVILPYYPIVGAFPFEGFPQDFKDKVVILSGGVAYKTMGRDNAFGKLVKDLLIQNPDAVFLFAGGGDFSFLRRYLAENGMLERCFWLGVRKDIDEVVKHCDIYLATYPITGGLMSQYAAANRKPILSYNSPDLPINDLEEFVCIKEDVAVTRKDRDSFLAEAKKLINDPEYRLSYGQKLYEVMQTREDFENEFSGFLKERRSSHSWGRETISYPSFSDLYLEVANSFSDTLLKSLWKAFPLLLPLLTPSEIPRIMSLLRQVVKRKIGRK